MPDQPSAQAYCANDSHDWKENYYGYQCRRCPLFYPYGSAPWEDFTGDTDDRFDDDDFDDDEGFDEDDCFTLPDGLCGKAGSEECEFCPLRVW